MVVEPGRSGRHPPRHPAGRPPSRSPTPNPTTARWHPRADGSSIPTARWCAPAWCGTTPPGIGLWQLDPDIAYLSGDRLPDSVRGFEVLEELNYSEKRLRQALSARDVGAVEILVRGVDVDPDALRRRLRLRGSQQVSVVITRIGSGTASRATAFICRPSR